jgi:hypothetical protein
MSANPNLKLNVLNDSGTPIFFVNQTTGIYSTLISTNTNTTKSINSTSASCILTGGLSIASTTDSSSYTAGGSITIAGGIAIGKNSYIGGTIYTTLVSCGSIATSGMTTGILYVTSITSGSIQVSDNVTIGGNLTVLGMVSTTNAIFTNLSTGILNAGNLTIGNINFTGTLSQNGSPYIGTGTGSQWIGTSGTLYYGTAGSSLVGINTTSPVYTLDISGGARITTGVTAGQSTFTSVSAGNSQFTGLSAANINFTGNLFQNGSPYIGSQWTTTSGNTLTYTSGSIIINSGFTSSFNSNTLGNIFTTGGNVGIGTTSPQASLHVTGLIPISPTGTGVFMGIDTLANTQIKLNSTSASYLDFSTSGTDWLSRIIYYNTSASLSGSLNFHVASSTSIGMSLNSSGTLLISGDIGAFASISDITLKTNITNISPQTALETVKTLRPVTFNWKDDIFNAARRGEFDSGFIAQEVENVIPHAVGQYTTVDHQNTYKNMRHERIIPYLVGSIQKLEETLRQLKDRIAFLESK